MDIRARELFDFDAWCGQNERAEVELGSPDFEIPQVAEVLIMFQGKYKSGFVHLDVCLCMSLSDIVGETSRAVFTGRAVGWATPAQLDWDSSLAFEIQADLSLWWHATKDVGQAPYCGLVSPTRCSRGFRRCQGRSLLDQGRVGGGSGRFSKCPG